MARGVSTRRDSRRSHSELSNSIQPRAFLRMHIFMGGTYFCARADTTRETRREFIVARQNAQPRGARSARDLLDTARLDRSIRSSNTRACLRTVLHHEDSSVLASRKTLTRHRDREGFVFDTRSANTCRSQLLLRHIARLFCFFLPG